MLQYNFLQHKSNKGFGGNLSDFKVGLHLVDLVLNCLFSTFFEMFYLAPHVTLRSALGRLESYVIDEKDSFAFCLDFLIAFAPIWVFIRVSALSAW